MPPKQTPDTDQNEEVTSNDQSATDLVKLVSRLDYPATLQYNNGEIIVPPRGSLKLVKSLIESELPTGLKFINL